MKKYLLSLITLFMVAIGIKADVMPVFSAPAEDGETVQYLFNVETKAFVLGANDWQTRASVNKEKGYQFKVKKNSDGKWTLSDYCHTNNKEDWDWRAMFTDGASSIWVDNAGGANVNNWEITALGENMYEITNSGVEGKLGVNDIATDSRLYMNGSNTTWAFVNEADYTTYMEAAAEEIAKEKQAKLDEANIKAIKAREELMSKTNIWGEGAEAYIAKTAELRQLVEAGGYTETVVNPTSATGWHASTDYNFLLTPWTVGGEACNNFDKALYINTWSTEGSSDGSNFHVPFFEYWTGDGNSLSANTLATKVSNLVPNGAYTVSAWVRVRIKNNGGAEANGITLTAGGSELNVCAGEQIGESQFRIINAVVNGTADAEGNLEIAFNIAEDNNISWLSYKNVYCVAPMECPAITFDAEEGAEIDLAETRSIHVSVALPEGMESSDDLYIEGVVVGKDGTNEPIFGYTDFEDGVDVAISRLTPGQAYVANITKIAFGDIIGMDEDTYMPIYSNTFAAEEGEALASLNFSIAVPSVEIGEITATYYEAGPVIDIIFKDQTDVAPSWNVDITLDGEKLNCEMGQEWNEIYGYPGKALAAGEHTIVFPAGSLMLNSMSENDTECSVTFTIEGGDESLIANADFAKGVIGDVNIATYAKDGTPNQMQEVPGWSFGVENGDARAAGVVAYGSATTLGGSTYTVPAAGPEGTNGNALAVVGVWTGTVQYVQDVTLPAGKYTMTVPVYNTAGTTAFNKNLIGVVIDSVETFATATSYPVGKWIDEIVTFELAETTEVKFSLGYAGANCGSAAAQHLFYDCVKIEAYDELAVAKAAAIAALPVGNESLFTPSAKEVEDVKAAIEAATTVEEVEAAAATTYTIPALEGEYKIYNTTAANYLGTDTTAVVLSAEPVAITFEQAEGGFYIKAGEEYINMKGDNNWNMSADAEAKTAWNFNLTDGNYTIQGPKGMIGTDNTEAGSACFGDKNAAKNGVWTISLFAEPTDIPEIVFSVEEGAEVDLATTTSINVNVTPLDGMEIEDDLYIEGVLLGKDGTNSPIFGYTDFEDGVDVNIANLTPGNAYMIQITKVAFGEVIGMDEETYMPIYSNVYEDENGLATLNFAIAAAPQEAPEIASITVNPNKQIVAVSFVAEDAAPTYNVSFALETAEGIAVNTTVAGEFGQNYGDMIYTFGGALTDGDYVLVLPAGSMTFLKDGTPFNAEIRVPFTVGEAPEPVIADGIYYIQNVESGLFLAGNNSWGTQASAVKTGDEFEVKIADGVYTITGTTLTSGNKTLGYNLYVDTNAAQNGNTWTIAPVEGEEGVFTIYGKGKKDNVEDSFEGYIAQSETEGAVTGYVLEAATEITGAAKWRFVTKAELVAGIEAEDDVTFLLGNPNFTRNHSVEAWIVDEGCTNKNLGGGQNANFCAESYHSPFNIHQTIENVPNGYYALTAQGFYRQDGEDVENLPVFYGNDSIAAVPVKTGDENSMANASDSFTAGLYTIDPILVKVTDGTMTVGIKCDNTSIWCIWDNFQLQYLGTEIPAGVNAIAAEATADGKYLEGGQVVIIKNGVKYNLAGQIIR